MTGATSPNGQPHCQWHWGVPCAEARGGWVGGVIRWLGSASGIWAGAQKRLLCGFATRDLHVFAAAASLACTGFKREAHQGAL
jgi:hypothetical protein